jgi:hypothetical protein
VLEHNQIAAQLDRESVQSCENGSDLIAALELDRDLTAKECAEPHEFGVGIGLFPFPSTQRGQSRNTAPYRGACVFRPCGTVFAKLSGTTRIGASH